MPAARIRLQHWNLQFHPFPNPFSTQKIPKLPQSQTLIPQMATQAKRPICPSCSKPTRICLCSRLRTQKLDNSVGVTILRHSLEKNHPLNSTRIATIGLKNVGVFTVSDVNYGARFVIRLIESGCGAVREKLNGGRHVFDEMPSRAESDEFVGIGSSELGADGIGLGGAEWGGIWENLDKGLLNSKCGCGEVAMRSLEANEVMVGEKKVKKTCLEKNEVVFKGSEVTDISFTIGKYGAITSFNDRTIALDKGQETSLDQLLASDIAVDCINNGFVVKKLQVKLFEGSNDCEEREEFEIAIPPGSVLLFPSERSVDVEDVDFEIKNLIVLDGTWAKANRMYNENPWLRLLPHLRLDLDKLSLYGEVRRQPRAGYLSTIESTVYAMKALGEDSEGLDGLLDVFESMVGDQRRCMNERLMKDAEKCVP